jgi:PAS domain S-box-containing protein
MNESAGRRRKSPPVVYCVLHEGRVTNVSGASREVSGIAPDTFVGKPLTDFIHPGDLARVAPFFQPGWSGSFSELMRLRDADGSWSWRMMRGVRTIDDDGRPSAVVRFKKIPDPHG